jgi:hypothetical protein
MRFGQKTAKKALFAGCLLVTGEGSFWLLERVDAG